MLSRRDLIATVPAVAAGFSLAAAAAVRTDGADAATVAALIMTLFPHPRLGGAYYDGVARAYLGGLDAGGRAGLAASFSTLDAGASGSWIAAAPAQRAERIRAHGQGPFLGGLLWRLPELIYRDPAVWALIGFDGSAIERGGWLNAGFDDIDWLPG